MVIRMAIVDNATNKVLNVIAFDPDVPWKPPTGTQIVNAATSGSIGDIWDGTKFIKVPDPVAE